MNTVAIVVAAGAGLRIGNKCKALTRLGGKPLLSHSLEVLQGSDLIDGICVVVQPERLCSFQKGASRRWPFGKIFAWVAGGERRQDSVAAALRVVPAEASLIAVHDAARPFITGELLRRLIGVARAKGAAVPAIEVVDTIKEVTDSGTVSRSLDRGKLRAIQTPQVFEAKLLREAYRNAETQGISATDDAMLVELIGHEVAVVEGSSDNIKITVREDVGKGEEILRKRVQKGSEMRIQEPESRIQNTDS
jgi:2-C-methyl-D-erythritol 4-phosphate cytidylyltransferase